MADRVDTQDRNETDGAVLSGAEGGYTSRSDEEWVLGMYGKRPAVVEEPVYEFDHPAMGPRYFMTASDLRALHSR